MTVAAYRWFVVLSLVMMACGCSQGESPFLMVQICLGNEQNLAEFRKVIQSIAQSEHMRFVDSSEKARQDLKTTAAERDVGPIVQLGVVGEKGVALTATNIELPSYQIAIGFSEGSDPSSAHAFAKRSADTMKSHWVVESLPKGQGAFPLKTCRSAK